jgi:hypothetical protein
MLQEDEFNMRKDQRQLHTSEMTRWSARTSRDSARRIRPCASWPHQHKASSPHRSSARKQRVRPLFHGCERSLAKSMPKRVEFVAVFIMFSSMSALQFCLNKATYRLPSVAELSSDFLALQLGALLAAQYAHYCKRPCHLDRECLNLEKKIHAYGSGKLT